MNVPSLIPGGSRVGSGDIEEEQLCSRDGELSTHVTVMVEETEPLGEEQESDEQCRAGKKSLRKMQGE